MTTPLRQTDRAFGIMFAVALTVIAGIIWWLFDAFVIGLMIAAAIFLIFALVAPGILLPFNRIWSGFGHRMGRVNNFVLLSLFFYLLILPISMIFRILGRDPLQRQINPNTDTYWRPLERRADKENYPDMF